MSLDIQIEVLPEPESVFAWADRGRSPRNDDALRAAANRRARILDSARRSRRENSVRLALVGPFELDVGGSRKEQSALSRLARGSARIGGDPRRRGPIHRIVDQTASNWLSATHRRSRGEELLDLFDGRIQGLFGDVRPDCILVCLPDELADLRISNPRLSEVERAVLERLQEEEESQQYSLFQPSPEELAAAEELRTQAEDLLFRTFYRALKAKVISQPNAVPIKS